MNEHKEYNDQNYNPADTSKINDVAYLWGNDLAKRKPKFLDFVLMAIYLIPIFGANALLIWIWLSKGSW